MKSIILLSFAFCVACFSADVDLSARSVAIKELALLDEHYSTYKPDNDDMRWNLKVYREERAEKMKRYQISEADITAARDAKKTADAERKKADEAWRDELMKLPPRERALAVAQNSLRSLLGTLQYYLTQDIAPNSPKAIGRSKAIIRGFPRTAIQREKFSNDELTAGLLEKYSKPISKSEIAEMEKLVRAERWEIENKRDMDVDFSAEIGDFLKALKDKK